MVRLPDFPYRFWQSILFVLICCPPREAYGQNLVPNGDFEAYNSCPWMPGGIQYSSGFTSFPTVKSWGNPHFGTPDYFNTCATSPDVAVPGNAFEYQAPHSGSAYAGICLNIFPPGYEFREYITTKLSKPMAKDSLYCVSFWVNPVALKKVPGGSQYQSASISEIGMSITDTMPKGHANSFILLQQYAVRNDSARYLTDTSRWYEIAGTYLASGGEEFLTIGCFNPKQPGWRYHSGPITEVPSAYVFIDDVSAIETPVFNTRHDDTFCGPPMTLTSSLNEGPFRWNTGDTTRSITVTAPGSYSCIAFKNNCTGHRDLYNIAPPLRVDSVHAPQVICTEVKRSAELTSSLSIGSYAWNTGETSRSIAVSLPGDYICTTTYECHEYRDIFHVDIDSTSAPVVRDTMICQHVIAPVLDVSDTGLTWYANSNSMSGTPYQPPINTAKGGTTTIYVSRFAGNCPSRKVPLTITIKELPAAHPSAVAFRCADGRQSYLVLGQEGRPDEVYSWNTGGTSCCIQPQQEGRYIRSATNVCGTAVDTFFLASRECDSCIFFPNAFSPNGDGQNDGFHAMKLCLIRDFQMKVFNRWGEAVYESDDVSARWDGQHKGIPAPAGTYMYFASFTTALSDKKYIVKGSVTLFR